MPDSIGPTWSRWDEAIRVMGHGPYLRRTSRLALVVGTVRFAINQLDAVLSGRADAVVWIKVGVTYCVPFVVSNLGVLIGTRRQR